MENKIVEWEHLYSVGIEEIDEQHKIIFDTINKLYDKIINTDFDGIEKIVDEFIAYGIYHFETESKYFEKYNYPYKEEHYASHQLFENEMKNFKENVKDFEKVTTDLFDYVSQWLTAHILTEDMKFGNFLKKINTNL